MRNLTELRKANRALSFSGYALTQAQELLLKAALLEGQAALTAWEQWKVSVDIETLDTASYALLPQLYQNLLAHGVEDAHMARLKGIYRRTWYANQLLLKRLKTLLSTLKETGIEAIVLGDAAFSALSSHDGSYRPISSFHLLLRSTDVDLAIQHLTLLNWQVPASSLGQQPIHLQDEQKHSLYLQVHLFWAIPQDYTDEQVWRYAALSSSQDMSGLMLSPTDQLLDVCARTFFKARVAQSVTPNESRPIHGIADALMLIRKSGDDLDWMRLITQAQRYQMILPVRNMLILLQQVLQLSLPCWVLPALLQMSIAQQEWLKYQVLAGDWRSFVRSRVMQLIQPFSNLENRLLQLRHRPFPGRRVLRDLLVSKKSVIE